MARLPSANELGGLPSAQSGRGVARYDLDAITAAGERMGDTIARAGARGGEAIARAGQAEGEAMAKAGVAVGQGLAAVGTGLTHAAAGIRDWQIGRENFELDRAKAAKLTKQAELDNEFEEDRDYGTMRDRYGKRLGEINKEIEGSFSSERVAERYRVWTQPRDVYSDGAIKSKARKIEGDVITADVSDKLEKLRRTGLSSADPTKRVDVIETGNGMISGLRDSGFISATQAANMKQKWATNYAYSSIEMMPDAEQVRALSGKAAEGSMVGLISPEDRVKLLRGAQSRIESANNKLASARSEQYERVIIDAAAGISTLPDRKAIQEDPLLTEPRRNTLLRQYDNANGDAALLRGVAAKYADPNGGSFNPFDKKEVDAIDKIFRHEGGDLPALQKVVDRTGIVPQSVAVKMRGDLLSSDVKRVASTLQLSSNLLNTNPNVFASAAGKKEFEDAVVAFQHNVNDLGMTAEQAARKHIEELTPEYQAKVKAKIKGEDVNEIVKKQVGVGDISGAFDQSWWPGSPSVGFDPGTRRSMLGDYEEKFREAYVQNGDVAKAKAIAADQLKKTWGVTRVNGSDVVMRYPPERAPVFAGVENAADLVAAQAVADIKAETGQTIDRKQLRLDPLPGGRTAQAYLRGEPPPYSVSWEDKSGIVHMLNPGRVFVADPAAMKASQTEKRRKDFERGREVEAARRVEESVRIPGVP